MPSLIILLILSIWVDIYVVFSGLHIPQSLTSYLPFPFLHITPLQESSRYFSKRKSKLNEFVIHSTLLAFRFPCHIHFPQSVLCFVVIKCNVCIWQIGHWFPGHFIVAFPLHLIHVATMNAQYLHMLCNVINDMGMLNLTSFSSDSLNLWWRLQSFNLICGVLVASADVYCITNHYMCL